MNTEENLVAIVQQLAHQCYKIEVSGVRTHLRTGLAALKNSADKLAALADAQEPAGELTVPPERLTEGQIEELIDKATIAFKYSRSRARGQQLTLADDFYHVFASIIETAVRAQFGVKP